MTTFDQIAEKIVTEQELIIGPLAWEEACKVQGMHVSGHHITFDNDDQKEIVNRLVWQYDQLFGRASHEVSREAVASLIADMKPDDIPSSLLN